MSNKTRHYRWFIMNNSTNNMYTHWIWLYNYQITWFEPLSLQSFLGTDRFFFHWHSKSCWMLRSATICWRRCSRTFRTNTNLSPPSNTHRHTLSSYSDAWFVTSLLCICPFLAKVKELVGFFFCLFFPFNSCTLLSALFISVGQKFLYLCEFIFM